MPFGANSRCEEFNVTGIDGYRKPVCGHKHCPVPSYHPLQTATTLFLPWGLCVCFCVFPRITGALSSFITSTCMYTKHTQRWLCAPRCHLKTHMMKDKTVITFCLHVWLNKQSYCAVIESHLLLLLLTKQFLLILSCHVYQTCRSAPPSELRAKLLLKWNLHVTFCDSR